MRILVMIMLLWTTASFAEHSGISPNTKELPMQCGDTEHLLDGLKERYSEEIVMMAASANAEGHELYHSLWINQGTSTWSFIVVNKQVGVTCIISSGENFTMFFPSNNGI
jgi:hypothetical protein